MSTALVPQSSMLPAKVEEVLVSGNLQGLSSEQRLSFYNAVCESLGLNPLTKPFEYLTLNGKMVLYARKDCTDQLRAIHGVSVRIVARESTDGIYVVTARAMRKDGREDESIGAVLLPPNGEARANAIMKCETKAKRRVTLSICGLGMLDETEVETIPGASFDRPGAATASASPSVPPPSTETAGQSGGVGSFAPPDPSPAGKRQRGGITFEALKAFGEVKKLLKAKTGSDADYYNILAYHKYEHADAIRDNKQGTLIYKQLATRLNALKGSDELRSTLVKVADVIGEGMFRSILSADYGCSDLNDALALDGNQTASLLLRLKQESDRMSLPAEERIS